MAKATSVQNENEADVLFDQIVVGEGIKQSQPPRATKQNAPVQKTYVFRLTKQITPRTEGDPPYQKYKSLPAQQLVYDGETESNRMLRFIAGVKSVWVDEQIKISKEVAESNQWTPEFVLGDLFLRWPQDKEKIECLMKRDDFAGNQMRISGKEPTFMLVNEQASTNNTIQYLQQKKKAVDLAHETKYDDIVAHAQFLGIAFKDAHGNDKAEETVHVEYIKAAEKDPAVFLRSYSNPMVKAQFLIKNAIADGKIDLNHNKGQAVWSDTKALITIIDLAKKPVDFLAHYAMTEKGAKFYETLKQL